MPDSFNAPRKRGSRHQLACFITLVRLVHCWLALVAPPKSNRSNSWQYNGELYKRRNEIERLFRRLKSFRRIFSRFEKLDVVFLAFLYFALIIEALRVG